MTLFAEVFRGTIPGYRIVPLSPVDEERILDFLVECEDYQLMESGRSVQPGDALAYLYDLPPMKPLNDKFTFAVEQNSRIVAILDLMRGYRDCNSWWIGLLLLSPSMRGKGLGRKIVDYLVKNLSALGVHQIQLAVLEENSAGYAFWQKMGFQQIEINHGRRHGNKIHNLLVMARRLK